MKLPLLLSAQLLCVQVFVIGVWIGTKNHTPLHNAIIAFIAICALVHGLSFGYRLQKIDENLQNNK